MTLYTLYFKLWENEEKLYYMPTKKAALEYLNLQKKCFGKSEITDISINSFTFQPTKKDVASLLNSEVGTGY
tara:strand:- start:155 stop:370 length:216 start_codon:yes stop_codon:yes gene_type:complete